MSNQKTLGNVLSTAGYATAFFGKSHLGGKFLRPDGEVAKNYGEANLTKKFLNGRKDHGFDYTLAPPGGILFNLIKRILYFFRPTRNLARWKSPYLFSPA